MGYGNWQIGEALGSGHFGQVYKVRRPLHNQVAVTQIGALKVLNYAAGSLERSTMKNEIGKIAKLRHPNLSFFIEDGENEAGEQWFVMEFVDGQSLEKFLQQRNQTMSREEWLDFAKNMLETLVYLRAQNVSHLDIKPDNIIRENNGTFKLVDFGLSLKTFGDAIAKHNLLWASPEQFGISAAEPSPASDVFNMGCVLYFAATGLHPWHKDGKLDLFFGQRLLAGEPPKLGEISEEFRFWLQPAFAIEPSARPDAKILLDELLALTGSNASPVQVTANPKTWFELEALLQDRAQRQLDFEITFSTAHRGIWKVLQNNDGDSASLYFWSPDEAVHSPATLTELGRIGWRSDRSSQTKRLMLALGADDIYGDLCARYICETLQSMGLAIESITIID